MPGAPSAAAAPAAAPADSPAPAAGQPIVGAAAAQPYSPAPAAAGAVGAPPGNAAHPWLAWWQTPGTEPLPVPGMQLSPAKLVALQESYLQRISTLWSDFVEHPERTSAPIADGRFADPAWQQNVLAAFMARAYLLNAEFLGEMAAAVDAAPKAKARLCFSVAQWIDATAPSNFLAFNPKAQQRIIETRGKSLSDGMQNLMEDVGRGRISQVDESAFEIGRNVATTEGAVVYENDLMQLIQYKPLTATVRTRPLLLVPPCINKYYILDLQPQNSFVRYCVDQGNTVFLVSWRNPHADLAQARWDDYVEQGPIAAIETVRSISGEPSINALGFCVGGTLLGTALAVMAARGEEPVASLTLLTSLLDFTHAGILDIFIDEAHVQMREAMLGGGGLMPGLDLANTFSSLRPNDLVWNYVVSNYLEGQRPPAFDLLYWNADSTNLPGPMYAWYLRNTYLENNLRVPNRVRCCGQPLDLRRIRVPTYIFGAREDHIVPWRGAYDSIRVLGGVAAPAQRFVLGASGHIAGTVNPAAKNRRSYWVHDESVAEGAAPPDADTWLASATEHPGSWWADWNRWLGAFGGAHGPAPASYGSTQHPVIEPAPGRYVREKA
jgi:polyhydroxyalkanoate synthase